MGYQRGGNRWGGGDEERWQGNRYEREGGSFGNWGSNRDRGDGDRGRERGSWGGGGEDRYRDRNMSGGRGRDEDRGFFERAGEQVRSWFSDDDDDERSRDENVRWQSRRGFEGGDPVHRREGGYRGGRSEERSYRPDSASAFGNQSDDRYGSGGSFGGYGDDMGSRPAETWGGSGFGSPDNNGRRFDRIDAGSTGTQGAHPMSSPVGGAYTGQSGGGIGPSGGFGGSSARSAAIMRQSQQGGQNPHDRHYSEWRQRQIDELDRDYDEYRREHQSKFESEFGGWRQKRQTQRQHMGRVTEHMTVVGSDGQHIGTVDAVKGDRIILTKNDEAAGGRHHSIPCSWIENVDDKVTVNKSADEAMRAWKDEENSRALFERDDQGSEGPHMLNRSFSGTYDDKK